MFKAMLEAFEHIKVASRQPSDVYQVNNELFIERCKSWKKVHKLTKNKKDKPFDIGGNKEDKKHKQDEEINKTKRKMKNKQKEEKAINNKRKRNTNKKEEKHKTTRGKENTTINKDF